MMMDEFGPGSTPMEAVDSKARRVIDAFCQRRRRYLKSCAGCVACGLIGLGLLTQTRGWDSALVSGALFLLAGMGLWSTVTWLIYRCPACNASLTGMTDRGFRVDLDPPCCRRCGARLR